MAEVQIVAGRECGWALRNYVALLEKGVTFETISANDERVGGKQALCAFTPYCLTPVLVHGKQRVFESSLINEYLDDRFPDPPLLPPTPQGRSNARQWVHFCDNALLPELIAIATQTAAGERDKAARAYRRQAEWFDSHVLKNDWRGPFFFGEQFTLLDIAFHTVFNAAELLAERCSVVAQTQTAAMAKWQSSISARESVRLGIEALECGV